MKYQKIIGIAINDLESRIDYEMNYPLSEIASLERDLEIQREKGNVCIVLKVES